MKGDYNKCNVEDFVYFHSDHPSASWQNGIYMIVKKREFPEVELVKTDSIYLGNIEEHGFISTCCGSIETDLSKLILKEDILNKVNNPDYTY